MTGVAVRGAECVSAVGEAGKWYRSCHFLTRPGQGQLPWINDRLETTSLHYRDRHHEKCGTRHGTADAGLQSFNLVEAGANSKIGAALRSPKESAAPISKSPPCPYRSGPTLR